MMIKKKIHDMPRKNVARRSVIMMPHPFYQGSLHAEHDEVILPGVSHYFVAA